MPKRLWEKLVIGPNDLKPSRDDMQIIGVFNPGVTEVNGEVVLLARVAERFPQVREGKTGLPRFVPGEGIVIDWFDDEDLDKFDPRTYRIKSTGAIRLTFISHLRVIRLADGKNVSSEGPIFSAAVRAEEYGVEDSRITTIGDTHYVTYVAVSRNGIYTCLASTKDFEQFKRHGIIFCPENKDVVLFPETIGGMYYALHRPVSGFNIPEMWLAKSPDLVHWGGHEIFMGGDVNWHNDRIGAGAPPIKMDEGWLEIYHGNRRPRKAGELVYYTAGALLLDLDDPIRVLKRSTEPIMTPQAEFEMGGFVANVVFPMGVVDRGEELWFYYGASDTYVGVAAFSKKDLLNSMQ